MLREEIFKVEKEFFQTERSKKNSCWSPKQQFDFTGRRETGRGKTGEKTLEDGST